MPTQEKIESVEELRGRLDGVRTVLLTEYRGLTVQQLSDLRKQLRSVSAEYTVIKNRLARLALSPDLAGRIGAPKYGDATKSPWSIDIPDSGLAGHTFEVK